MYLCTRNYDLKRGGTFETAKAGTFHSVTAGTLIPLSPDDDCIDVYRDIKDDFEEAHITDYDEEQIAPLILNLLEVKRQYDGLLIAVEEELKKRHEETTKDNLT